MPVGFSCTWVSEIIATLMVVSMCPAYEVLSDEKKRQQYDQFGEAAFSQSGGPSPGSGHFSSAFHDFDFNKFFEDSNMFFGRRSSSNSNQQKTSGGRHRSTMFDFDDFFDAASFGQHDNGFEGMFGGFDWADTRPTHHSSFGDRQHHRNQYSNQQYHVHQNAHHHQGNRIR